MHRSDGGVVVRRRNSNGRKDGGLVVADILPLNLGFERNVLQSRYSAGKHDGAMLVSDRADEAGGRSLHQFIDQGA